MSAQGLNGKVTLVTGVPCDIGATIADTLVAADAKVIGATTNESGAAAIGERPVQWGGEGRALSSAEPETIESPIADIERESGKLNILVNNAGITRDDLLMRMKKEEWGDVMRVNLKSVFRASKTVLRGMMKQCAGRIINTTPVVGVMGNAGQTNYAAAKAGLIDFSKSMAYEVDSHGITANCVTSGFIDTDITRTLPGETRKTFETQASLGEFGEARDIAGVVLFLASNQAEYITDQTLHVSDGILMP